MYTNNNMFIFGIPHHSPLTFRFNFPCRAPGIPVATPRSFRFQFPRNRPSSPSSPSICVSTRSDASPRTLYSPVTPRSPAHSPLYAWSPATSRDLDRPPALPFHPSDGSDNSKSNSARQSRRYPQQSTSSSPTCSPTQTTDRHQWAVALPSPLEQPPWPPSRPASRDITSTRPLHQPTPRSRPSRPSLSHSHPHRHPPLTFSTRRARAHLAQRQPSTLAPGSPPSPTRSSYLPADFFPVFTTPVPMPIPIPIPIPAPAPRRTALQNFAEFVAPTGVESAHHAAPFAGMYGADALPGLLSASPEEGGMRGVGARGGGGRGSGSGSGERAGEEGRERGQEGGEREGVRGGDGLGEGERAGVVCRSCERRVCPTCGGPDWRCLGERAGEAGERVDGGGAEGSQGEARPGILSRVAGFARTAWREDVGGVQDRVKEQAQERMPGALSQFDGWRESLADDMDVFIYDPTEYW